MFVIVRISEDFDLDTYCCRSKKEIVGYSESEQECLDWVDKQTIGEHSTGYTEIQPIIDNDYIGSNVSRSIVEFKFQRYKYRIIPVKHI